MGFNSAAAVKKSRGMSKLSKVRRSVPKTVWPRLVFRFDGNPIKYTRRRFRGDQAPNRLQPQVPTGGVVQSYLTYDRRKDRRVVLPSVSENLAAEGLEQLAQSQAVDVKGVDELLRIEDEDDITVDEYIRRQKVLSKSSG